jgi:hypothetical protein
LTSVRNAVALPGPTPQTTFVVFDYGPTWKDAELTVFCTLVDAGCKAPPVTNVVTASMAGGDTGSVGALLEAPMYNMPLDCFAVVTTEKLELCVPIEATTGTVEPGHVNMVGSVGGAAYYKSDVSSDDPATWSDQPITGDAAWTSLSGSMMTVSVTTGQLFYVEDIAEWLDQEPGQTFPDGWTSNPSWTGDPMFPGPFATDNDALVAWTPGGGPLKGTRNFWETGAAWDLEILDAEAIWADVDMNRIVYASVLPNGDIEIRLIQDVWSDAGQGARLTTTLYTVPLTPAEARTPGTTQTVKSVSLSGQFLVFMTEDSNGLKTIYLAGEIEGDITVPVPITGPFSGNPEIALDVRGPILVAAQSGGGTTGVLSIANLEDSAAIEAPPPNGGSPGLFGGSGGSGGNGGFEDVEWMQAIDGVSLDQISVSSSGLTSASLTAFVQRVVTWLEESPDLSWLDMVPGVSVYPADPKSYENKRATETRASKCCIGFAWLSRSSIAFAIEGVLNALVPPGGIGIGVNIRFGPIYLDPVPVPYPEYLVCECSRDNTFALCECEYCVGGVCTG